MNKIFLLAGFLIFAHAAFCGAPDSVAGMVYYEESVTFVRSNTAVGRILKTDGTFREIYSVGTYGTQTVGAPHDGTWSYRKTGVTTAELVFDGVFGDRALTFSTDSGGTLVGGPNLGVPLNGVFTLVNPSTRSPLLNVSNRSFVMPRGTSLTGFVVTEGSNRALIRAVGPGLAAFGITQTLAAPVIRIFNAQTELAWNSTSGAVSLTRAAAYVGAFPLSASSNDSATIMILPSGAYTVQVSAANETDSGEVLIEVYILR